MARRRYTSTHPVLTRADGMAGTGTIAPTTGTDAAIVITTIAIIDTAATKRSPRAKAAGQTRRPLSSARLYLTSALTPDSRPVPG
jgi:hypothetical protein